MVHGVHVVVTLAEQTLPIMVENVEKCCLTNLQMSSDGIVISKSNALQLLITLTKK